MSTPELQQRRMRQRGLVENKLYRWMQVVNRHPARHKHIAGGRGIHKTDFLIRLVTLKVLDSKVRGAVGLYTAPNFVQGKRIVWDRWNTWLDRQPRKIKVGADANDLVIRLIDGKSIVIMGMDKPEKGRGIHPVFRGDDERAYSRPEGFGEVLEEGLAHHQGGTCDGTTAKGRNAYYREWAKGAGPDAFKDHASWQISQEEVGSVPYAELMRYKPGMGGDMEMTQDYYDQEWCGVFLLYEGLLFPEFIAKPWPMGHIMSRQVFEAIKPQCYLFGSLDWGRHEKTVLHCLAKTPTNQLIAYDELVVTNRTPEQIAALARGRGMVLPIVYADPSCWNDDSEGDCVAYKFHRANLRVTKGKRDLPTAIQHIRTMMAFAGEDEPHFYIVEGTCRQAQSDFSLLQHEHLAPTGGTFRSHVECHACDSIRYGAMSMYAGKPIEIVTETPKIVGGPLQHVMDLRHGRVGDEPRGYSRTGQPLD